MVHAMEIDRFASRQYGGYRGHCGFLPDDRVAYDPRDGLSAQAGASALTLMGHTPAWAAAPATDGRASLGRACSSQVGPWSCWPLCQFPPVWLARGIR